MWQWQEIQKVLWEVIVDKAYDAAPQRDRSWSWLSCSHCSAIMGAADLMVPACNWAIASGKGTTITRISSDSSSSPHTPPTPAASTLPQNKEMHSDVPPGLTK